MALNGLVLSAKSYVDEAFVAINQRINDVRAKIVETINAFDNKVVMEICSQLRQSKRLRQLVFATHNPNFVVNGDADKVVALAAPPQADLQDTIPSDRKIFIEADGAIETSAVRETITETMEGGRAAFELRARKYDFENT